MREQKKNKNQQRQECFEEIYIRTYQNVCTHVRFLILDIEKAKKLLILTYADLYSNIEDIFGKDNITEWLKKKADDIAELKLGISSEQMAAAHMREQKQENILNVSSDKSKKLDETSLFFEIWDYLKLDENQDSGKEFSKLRIIAQNIFSCILLTVAVGALIIGADKLKEQIEILKKPFVESLPVDVEDSSEAQKNQKNHIKIANKIVYLSDIGQVLYSVPLEQTEWASQDPENLEVQVSSDGWVYYLPCPERKESVLSKVSPDLFHTLYRMKKGNDEIEIISREVDDYYILDDKIYIECFERIQVIDSQEEFDKVIPGMYVHRENCEFYLRDMLGRDLEKENDGNIYYGDRILQMDGDRIADVIAAERINNGIKYELKSVDNEKNEIYRNVNGVDELFIQEENGIDSFCISGDWLYYSAYVRKGGSGAHYSKVFRKSLTEDKKPEEVHDEFTGRILQMYYCQDNGQIYGNYIPKNWKNNHGVIAVIAPDGQMSYLEDTIERQGRETTGNDVLEFVMMRDNQVYCYWKDYQWEKGKEPILLWRDVVIIPNGKRNRVK